MSAGQAFTRRGTILSPGVRADPADPADPHGCTRPAAWATAAASVRVEASSLVRIRETWTLAVFGEMYRRFAIAQLVAPWATRLSTSRSRSVRKPTRWARWLIEDCSGMGSGTVLGRVDGSSRS